MRTNEISNRNSDNQSHRFNFKVEYKPDSLTDIVFRPNVILNRTINASSRVFKSTFDKNGRLNDGDQYFDQTNTSPSFFGEFSVLRRLKKGSVSIRLNGTQNTYESNWINEATINKIEKGTLGTELTNQLANQENVAKTYTLGLNYVRQLNKQWSTNLGYTYNKSRVDAAQLTLNYNPLTDSYNVFVPNFSSNIDNKNWLHAARLGFIYARNHWTYNFGFALQETTLDAITFNNSANGNVEKNTIKFCLV